MSKRKRNIFGLAVLAIVVLNIVAFFHAYKFTHFSDDVDVIVEVLSFSEHANFEEKLRVRGFSPDVNYKVRVRYKVQNVTVDFMPTTDIAVGFENRWYRDGFKTANDYQIDDNTVIKILTAPYFLATKLEAFKNRGGTDPRQSHDFEDIVYVL